MKAKRAVALRCANTILSLGLNILIKRLGLDPRWRYAMWALIIANEIRGAITAYYGFGYLFN